MNIKEKTLKVFSKIKTKLKKFKLNKKKRNIITYSLLIILIILLGLICYLAKQNSIKQFDVSIENKDINNYTESIIEEQIDSKEETNNVECKYYVYVSIESLLISGILIYLVMSSNNELKFKKTFINTDKIIIYTDSIILLSVAIVLLSIELIKIMPNKALEETKQDYKYQNIIKTSIDKKGDIYSTNEESKTSLLVTGNNSVNLYSVSVIKSGDSKSINGNNSSLLVNDNSKVSINDSSILTTSLESEAIYVDGGKKYNKNNTNLLLENTSIKTNNNESIGIYNNNGNITLNNSYVESLSTNSPLIINTGKLSIKKGYYTSSLYGSPNIINSGVMTVNKAYLASSDSDIIRLTNSGKITLNKCIIASSEINVNDDTSYPKSIFIYGENEKTKTEFTMKNSDLLVLNGDTFFVTNTKAKINLYSNSIYNSGSTSLFMRVQSNIYGDKNNNGGYVDLTLDNQTISGYIAIDEDSEIHIVAKNNSILEVSVNPDDQGKKASISLDKSSTLKLIADTYITKLTNKDKTNSNIELNGHKLYINGVLQNF